VLLLIIFLYGSYPGESTCKQVQGGNCIFFQVVTFNFLLPKYVGFYLAGTSAIVLACVSEWTQVVLNTWFF